MQKIALGLIHNLVTVAACHVAAKKMQPRMLADKLEYKIRPKIKLIYDKHRKSQIIGFIGDRVHLAIYA